MNNIRDILNENISFSDKIDYLSNMDLSEFNELSYDEVEKISSVVVELFDSIEKELVKIEKSKEEISRQMQELAESQITYESIARKRELQKEFAKLDSDREKIESIYENQKQVISSLNDRKIDVAKTEREKIIRENLAEITQNQVRVETQKKIIANLEEDLSSLISQYSAAEEKLKDIFNSEEINDELENDAIRTQEQMKAISVEKSKIQSKLTEQRNMLTELERQNNIITKQQEKYAAEEKKEQELNDQLQRFLSLCSKQENEFKTFEQAEIKPLFNILKSNKKLNSTQRAEVFNKYVECQDRLQGGNKFTVAQKAKLKDEKPLISSAKSVIAKGKLSTIKFMQDKFEKYIFNPIQTMYEKKVAKAEEKERDRLEDERKKFEEEKAKFEKIQKEFEEKRNNRESKIIELNEQREAILNSYNFDSLNEVKKAM